MHTTLQAYVLDTDSLSNFLDNSRNYPHLVRRILQTDKPLLFVSVVCVEEYLRFVLAGIQKERATDRVVDRYLSLQRFIERINAFQILPFDADALQTFIAIPGAVRQHHPNDCRIAASAMSRGYTVITRNTRHFAKIPGVNYEDWTLAETLPPAP